MRCPCGSGLMLDECCGPALAGSPAPTAEQLMRSRFTAFATGDAEYLLATWDPSTRPAQLELDGDLTWTLLEITDRVGGGPLDPTGVVAFVAHYRGPHGDGHLVERSRFRRVGRRWYYLDGDLG